MATVQLTVFRIEGRLYALHLSDVVQVIRAVDVTPLPEAPQIVLGVINLHGTVIPVIDTRRRLGLATREVGVNDQFIIARMPNRTVALVIDDVSGVVERLADEIVKAGAILPQLDVVEGAVQLEDGLTLIQRPDRFLSLDDAAALDRAMSKQSTNGG